MKISTLDLYGIDPKTLSNMLYKDALSFMLSKLIEKRGLAIDIMFSDNKIAYEELCEIGAKVRYYDKAIKTKEAQLEELM